MQVSTSDPEQGPRAEREAAYLWLERELRGNRGATSVGEPQGDAFPLPDAEEDPESEATLHDWVQKRVIAQPPNLESKQTRKTWQEGLRQALSLRLGLQVPLVPLAPQLQPIGDHHRLTITAEPGIEISGLWLPAEGVAPALLALHPSGKEAALQEPWVQGLRAAGWSVLALDVRFRGELTISWQPPAHRPEAGMAVTDTLAGLRWLLGQEGVDPGRVVVLGTGDQGVTALLTGGLDERVAGVLADCQNTTYRDGGEGLPPIPGILLLADVPQVASLMAPRLLWLYQVPEDRVGFASRRFYDWTRRMQQALGEDESLKMSTGPGPDPAGLVEWLERRLKKLKR